MSHGILEVSTITLFLTANKFAIFFAGYLYVHSFELSIHLCTDERTTMGSRGSYLETFAQAIFNGYNWRSSIGLAMHKCLM
jgi:hypothetical protein